MNSDHKAGVLSDNRADELFIRFADGLRELEIVIGEMARPVVAEVRAEIEQVVARRLSGDVPGALGLIRHAMERLAALGSQLDRDEGAMMRAIAARFSEALSANDRGTAKETVGLMRRRAGDLKTDEPADW